MTEWLNSCTWLKFLRLPKSRTQWQSSLLISFGNWSNLVILSSRRSYGALSLEVTGCPGTPNIFSRQVLRRQAEKIKRTEQQLWCITTLVHDDDDDDDDNDQRSTYRPNCLRLDLLPGTDGQLRGRVAEVPWL